MTTYTKFHCNVEQCRSERKRLEHKTLKHYQQEGDKGHNKEKLNCINEDHNDIQCPEVYSFKTPDSIQ
jgi:hypothetical protein